MGARCREFQQRADDGEADRGGARDAAGLRVVHELKNPLSAVKALVQLGLRNPVEHASHERLAVVEREVARMQEIVQAYLSAGRDARGLAPGSVQLGALAADTVRVLAGRAAAGGVRLSSRGDAVVEGDASRLREALANLVANALEATPDGGSVEVEVVSRGEVVEVAVRDTGRGMAPEVLRRVGTPWFTTREDGTGLGVSLAREVVARHGGTLSYESAPGEGTTARATLPRRLGAVAEPQDARRTG